MNKSPKDGDKGEKLSRLVRPHLRNLEPYAPIEPTETLARRVGLSAKKIVKLDGNENPYGPSPKVLRALARFRGYHIYPDPLQRDLRCALAALARHTGLGEGNIVVGNGSDELLDLIMRLLLEPGDKVINCVPTFGMYRFNTQVCGGVVVDVPRDEGYEVDVAAVKKAVDSSTKLIFIASPNNPTGNPASQEDVLALLKTGVAVVIDEAYYEFYGQTFAPLVPQYENLMVLRTFSKWAGLAGLRVGYGFFPLSVAELLDKIKPPYNVNVAGLVAALASLEDLDYLKEKVAAIVEERGRLFAKLLDRSFLRPLPSQANFILCHVVGKDASRIKQELEKEGIFIKYVDTPELRNALRISVGKPEHTDRLIEALNKVY